MVDAGCLETSSALPLPERLLAIHTHVVGLIELHQPHLLAVERLFFSKNAQTAFAVGQARGVVLLAGAAGGLPVREATPSEVKISVTGYGAADKEQVGRMVAVCLSLDSVPRPDDAADALAVAIWAANSERDLNGNGNGHAAARPGVLDLSSVTPGVRGETAYDRAVSGGATTPGRATVKPGRATVKPQP